MVRISNPTGPHPDLFGRILKKAEGGRKVGVEWQSEFLVLAYILHEEDA